MAQEIEAKFAVSHLGEFRQRLLQAGARLSRDRVLERNWRFDDPQGSMTSAGNVLRLRQSFSTRLTFKRNTEDPMVREEIEFEVDQAKAARAFLKALGFQIIFIYEKYRETFTLDGAKIVLDHLPFGSFVEVESDDRDHVKEIGRRLALDWSKRVSRSYAELFRDWNQQYGAPFRDATFANFEGRSPIQPKQLGLQDALKKPQAEAEDPRDG